MKGLLHAASCSKGKNQVAGYTAAAWASNLSKSFLCGLGRQKESNSTICMQILVWLFYKEPGNQKIKQLADN